MILSDFDDKKYKDIVNALEPRHAPSTAIRFQRRRVLMPLLRNALRIAAILAIGVAAGIAVSSPDTTIASDKVAQLGFKSLHEVRTCEVVFNGRLLPSTPRRPLRLSPAGRMTSVKLTYSSEGGLSDMSCLWTLDGVENKLVARGDSCVLFSDEIIKYTSVNEAVALLDKLFNSGYVSFRQWLDIENPKMTKDGDIISIKFRAKKEKVDVEMDFSDKTGRIMAVRLYDNTVTPRLLMLETTSIKYEL